MAHGARRVVCALGIRWCERSASGVLAGGPGRVNPVVLVVS